MVVDHIILQSKGGLTRRVQTARNMFRGYGPEYIDVRLDADAVVLAKLIDLQQEIETHRRLLDGAVKQMLDTAHQTHPQSTVAD